MSRSLPGWLLLLAAAGAARAEIVDIRQGTNLALAVDPAGETIVVDLLGGLWRLPASGGGATALIDPGNGVAQPRFDPTGERIVFQRWRDGQWDIWQLTLADGEYRPLTETAFDEREPDYSPDGGSIVFASDRGGSYAIWALDIDSGALRQLTDEPGNSRFPTYADSGELAYVHRLGQRSSLRRYDGGPRGTQLMSSARRIDAPSWRPGGGVLVFNEREDGVSSDLAFYIDADEPVQRRLTADEDVFAGRVAWLSPAEYVYAADGRLWRRGIASIERKALYLFATASIDPIANGPVVGPLDAPGPHAVTGINGQVRHAASGRSAFTALGDLWLVDEGEVRQLTDDDATDAWPDFSPDGEWLIFASDRGGTMQVWRLRIDSGQLLRLTSDPGRAFLPRVSRDGEYVAFLETPGFGPWDAAELKLVAIDRPFAAETLASGLYDASDLSWQDTRLRLLARNAAATEPLPRIFETPAADTEAAPESGRAEAYPTDAAADPPEAAALSWRPAAATEPFVIQAGRMFDGIGDGYTDLVDIHIEGQRITDIVRRGQLPLPDRVIDASELTVLPGLIDVHVHQSTLSAATAGRLWLRHGITTVREVMADLPTALERAETWASGRQPGPRLVISPALPLTGIELPPGSPLVVGGGRVARGLAHDLVGQLQRAGEPLAALPPVLALGARSGAPGGAQPGALNGVRPDTPVGALPGAPVLAVSTLGRSYQDIVSEIDASGVWLPTGLAALDAVVPTADMGNLTATIERVMRGSGRVAIGSDAPAAAYGAGFHDELALLAGQGVPNARILRWATAGGAIALGLTLQLGTLEPGRLADLVIVDGDPLDDIGELRRIEAVVRGGVWYTPDDLGEAR